MTVPFHSSLRRMCRRTPPLRCLPRIASRLRRLNPIQDDDSEHFQVVQTTAFGTSLSHSKETAMNTHAIRWVLLAALLVATSAVATYYPHLYLVEIAECDPDYDCGTMPDFLPSSLTIVTGDSVLFANATGNILLNAGPGAHNVVADDGSFRCAAGCDGEGGNGNPSASYWSFTRVFDTPGVVKYHDEASAAAGVITILPRNAVAVEYYRADWGFYFVTAFPDEIDALDGGAFGGEWKRTGETFIVWTDASDGALPTCRFFSTAFAPKSSHFYTVDATECASLKAGTAWQYEGIAFYLQLPAVDPKNFVAYCPFGTVPLYRLYNNGVGGAPNHRYTTAAWVLQPMLSMGWVAESPGTNPVYACVRPRDNDR